MLFFWTYFLAVTALAFLPGVVSRFAFAVPLYVVRLQRGNRRQKIAVFHIFTLSKIQIQKFRRRQKFSVLHGVGLGEMRNTKFKDKKLNPRRTGGFGALGLVTGLAQCRIQGPSRA